MEPRVLIIGATGMLGRELVRACHNRLLPLVQFDGSHHLDVVDTDAVSEALREVEPTIVINAAAYTDVDAAERDFDHALHVNGFGAGNVARACRQIGALLVHYSTDYVFDGNALAPYTTDHPPDPINAYGLSKLAGEKELMSSGCEYLLLRTSWLFAPHGRNFFRTIADLARRREAIDVVDDQQGRPTYGSDLAQMTLRLISATARSTCGRRINHIINAANVGSCTWYELAREVVRRLEINCEVRPTTSSAMQRPAPRPRYSVLDLGQTQRLIGKPRHWTAALDDCIAAMKARQPATAHVHPS